jgi:tetratricopeptide (TPR) repeat protein
MKFSHVVAILLVTLFATAANAEDDYKALYDQGVKLAEHGRYDDAAEVLQKSLDLATAKFGADSETADTIALSITNVRSAAGHNTGNDDVLRTVRDHYIKRYGPKDSRLAPIYLGLAKSQALRDKDEAVASAKNAVELYEHKTSKPDPNYIRALTILGYAQMWHLRPDDARSAYRKALKVSKKMFGDDAEITGEAHFAMGQYHFFDRDYALAERDFKRALAIFGAKLPPTDPRALVAHGALVPVYKGLNRTDEAMEQTMELAMLAPDAEGQDQPLYQIAPDFPFYGTKNFYEGPIDVRFTVTAEGRVDHIEFFGQRSNAANEDVVKKALSEWIYKPRVVNGKPVASVREIRFTVQSPNAKK